MRKLTHYFSLWHTLLSLSLLILLYLSTVLLKEALSYSSLALYFNHHYAHLSWAPSPGNVDHYLLEITDTHFLSEDKGYGSLTTVSYTTSSLPSFQLPCEHNHSYQVRVKAVSPSGHSSDYSEPSVLFICDQKQPLITPAPLPSPYKVRSSRLPITGTFNEPHLSSLTINGQAASLNPAEQSFSATVNLEVGENSIAIVAYDLAGNTSSTSLSLTYAPLTILSLPLGAQLYWNGNYAYPGIPSGTTPQSYTRALNGPHILRLCYPGFNDYYGMIDFSDLSQDTYTITLSPFSPIHFSQLTTLEIEKSGLDSHLHPLVVDYNLDGRKDLLIGTGEGRIALLANTGTESAPFFSGVSFLRSGGEEIEVGSNAAPFMVDLNNDGAQDLLLGSGEGSILYYANQGSNREPVLGLPVALKDTAGEELGGERQSVPCVVEWNGDGKKDLLIGSGSGKVVVYVNVGSDSEPVFSVPRVVAAEGGEVVVEGSAAPFMAEWNGDGRKDLLVGGGGYVEVYVDTASEGEPMLRKVGKVAVGGEELVVEGEAVPFLVDWDQDGRQELLIGSNGLLYRAS